MNCQLMIVSCSTVCVVVSQRFVSIARVLVEQVAARRRRVLSPLSGLLMRVARNGL